MSEPTAKPQAVNRAVMLLLIISAAGVAQATAAYIEKRTLDSGTIEASKYLAYETIIYRTTDLRGSLTLAVALGLCAAVLSALMIPLLRRGYRWARMVTWIVGVALIIGELILMTADTSAVRTGDFISSVDVPGGDPAMVAMLNTLLVPDWFPPIHYVAEFIILGGMIWTCINLAKPESTDFFVHEDKGGTVDSRSWSLAKPESEDAPSP